MIEWIDVIARMGSGFLVGWIGCDIVRYLFPKFGLLDYPERYGLTRDRLPYPSGLMIAWLVLGYCFFRPDFWLFLWPLIFLTVISFWDDKRPLPAWLRLGVHVLIASLLFVRGVQMDIIGHPFLDTNIILTDSLPGLAFLATVVWLVMIQNALNWFDGIPGATVGISSVGFLTLGVLGMIRPELLFDPAQAMGTEAAFWLSGLCIGMFWMHWKHKIILGDTGSMVLGLMLGSLALLTGAKVATLVLVLLLPLMDVFVVLGRRILLEKKSLFASDLKHLPHLMARRYGERKATLMLVGTTFCLGFGAVLLTGVLKLFLILAGIIILAFWYKTVAFFVDELDK